MEIQLDKRLKGIRTRRPLKKRKVSGHIEYNIAHIPRILKDDIRRQYAVMFVNVHNTADYAYMMKFINRFYRSDTFLTITRTGEVYSTFIFWLFKDLNYFLLGTINEQVKFRDGECHNLWFKEMTGTPDLVMRLLSSQIKLRSDGTGMVVGRYELSGTRIVTLNDQSVENVSPVHNPEPQPMYDRVKYPIELEGNDNDIQLLKSIEELIQEQNSDCSRTDSPDIFLSEDTTSRESFDHTNLSFLSLDSSKGFNLLHETPQSKKLLPFVSTGEVSLHFDSDSQIYHVAVYTL